MRSVTFVVFVAVCVAAASSLAASEFIPNVVVTEGKGSSRTITFYSDPVDLYPGQVANTNRNDTPLDGWPRYPIALHKLSAEVVDEDLQPVPLYIAYLHHWVVDNGSVNSGPCRSLAYQFGVGAESRGTPTEFPKPYALVTDGTEDWGQNIHLIDQRDVFDKQRCIECHCEDGSGGGIRCCQDQSYCNTGGFAKKTLKRYHIKITIEFDEDIDQAIPVNVFVLDVAGPHGCGVEYNIPSCPEGQQDCTHNKEVAFHVVDDLDVVFAQAHQHIGGEGIRVFVDNNIGSHEKDTHTMCETKLRYGDGVEAGNEAGFVTALNTCKYQDNPISLRKGDTLRINSDYKMANPPHEGVMGFMYLAAVPANQGSAGPWIVQSGGDHDA